MTHEYPEYKYPLDKIATFLREIMVIDHLLSPKKNTDAKCGKY
jgi:hypothetical protein